MKPWNGGLTILCLYDLAFPCVDVDLVHFCAKS